MLVNHKPELVGKFKIGFANFAISELELAKDRDIISETEFKDYMHYVDLIAIGFDSHVPFLTDKILYRLINYKPLSELTGDEEWIQNDKARTKDPLFYFYIWSGTTHMLGIKDFSTYGIEWRCWLFVPSEERLKNTPWEEC